MFQFKIENQLSGFFKLKSDIEWDRWAILLFLHFEIYFWHLGAPLTRTWILHLKICLPVLRGHELDPAVLEGEHELSSLQLHDDATVVQKVSVTIP